jgi:hypothetical protein
MRADGSEQQNLSQYPGPDVNAQWDTFSISPFQWLPILGLAALLAVIGAGFGFMTKLSIVKR